MQKVQISGELFIYLVKYFLPEKGEPASDIVLREMIRDELQDKVDRMARHFDYTEKIKKNRDFTL